MEQESSGKKPWAEQRPLGKAQKLEAKVLSVRGGNRRNKGRLQTEGRGENQKNLPGFVILLIRGVMFKNKTLRLISK